MIFLYFAVYAVFRIAIRPFARTVHDWNRRARWERQPWYVTPKPGSAREWLERDRPRLHQVGAWAVSELFLSSLCSFVAALIVAIVVYWIGQ